MIIEFELQGSKCLHKGIFDTQGFWVRYEPHGENLEGGSNPEGWKIYSHGSFSFYHEDKTIVDEIYSRLLSILRGSQGIDIEKVGFLRKLNK